MSNTRLESPSIRSAPQAAFLESYHARADALEAQLEGTKAAHKEAKHGMRAAEGKIRQLREALLDEEARKEVGLKGWLG